MQGADVPCLVLQDSHFSASNALRTQAARASGLEAIDEVAAMFSGLYGLGDECADRMEAKLCIGLCGLAPALEFRACSREGEGDNELSNPEGRGTTAVDEELTGLPIA